MTISNTASAQTFLGNGVTNPFTFSIIAAPANTTATQAAANMQVTYTNATGVTTTLPTSAYTLAFNTDYAGGTLTYPTVGSPIAVGTSLTITRIVPLTQTTSISNQGDFAPEVIESALDTLCLEIQQVAARTGQSRGTWVTGSNYNYGDLVQDGTNGANTTNFYLCAQANTSGVWATDLAAGYWSLAVNVQAIVAAGGGLPLTGGTITGNLTVTGTTTGNFTGNLTGNAATVTTNANLTGPVTSTGNATTIIDNAITYRRLDGPSMPKGFVNKFRNPVMDIWSRGTSLTLTAGSPAYTADGWICSCTGVNITIAQQAELTNVANSMRVFGAVGCTNFNVKQRIESLFASQLMYQGYTQGSTAAPITIQFRVQNNTGATISPTLTVKHANAVDNFGALTTDLAAVSIGSVVQGAITTLAYTYQPQSGTGNGLEVTLDFGNGLNVSERVWISAADIRITPGLPIGICTTPPLVEVRDISTEQDLNARYLPVYSYDGTPNMYINAGQAVGTTTGLISQFFRTRTRANITGVTISSATHFGVINSSGSGIALTALTFGTGSKEGSALNYSVASGLTGGNATTFYASNASASIILTGAEL